MSDETAADSTSYELAISGDLTDAERAEYWQRAYERMAARNGELSMTIIRMERERDEAHLRADRISEALDEGDGFWRSCSGCHELNEGYPTGEFSAVFRTHVGCGCSECGGLGVVWDDADYADMGDFIAGTDRSEEPTP